MAYTTPGTFYNQPRGTRLATAKAFVDQRVRVLTQPVKVARDQREEIEGVILTVALSPNGTTSDLLILRRAGKHDQAVSLAIVVSITSQLP
jgi:hypothetical protein